MWYIANQRYPGLFIVPPTQERCSMQNVLSLEHPEVQSARREFERRKTGRKPTLPFEELFTRFSSGVAAADVAREAGVSREAICYLYDRYFLSLFQKTGQDRKRERAAEKAASRADAVLSAGVVKIVSEQARAAGCTVAVVISRQYVLKEALIINGHLCAIHHVTKLFTPSNTRRSYAIAQIAPESIARGEVTVIRATVTGFLSRTFVIPSSALAGVYSEKRKKGYINLYIPLERLPCMSRVNYWDYENAWHLLVPKEP